MLAYWKKSLRLYKYQAIIQLCYHENINNQLLGNNELSFILGTFLIIIKVCQRYMVWGMTKKKKTKKQADVEISFIYFIHKALPF